MKPGITLILAHDEAGTIGAGDGLPWPRLPEDMQNFLRQTRGKPVVMGRRTIETIGKPLPWRNNIVMTRDPDWTMPGVTTVSSPEAAIAAAGRVAEIMVIGGAEIYRLFQPMASRILLTVVPGRHRGDVVWAPDLHGWIEQKKEVAVRNGETACTFFTYERGS